MKNEFGACLDKNGYAPSIVTFDTDCCFLCDGQDEKLDRHECFGGAMREKSKRLGLWVPLCHVRCHEYGPDFLTQTGALKLPSTCIFAAGCWLKSQRNAERPRQ